VESSATYVSAVSVGPSIFVHITVEHRKEGIYTVSLHQRNCLLSLLPVQGEDTPRTFLRLWGCGGWGSGAAADLFGYRKSLVYHRISSVVRCLLWYDILLVGSESWREERMLQEEGEEGKMGELKYAENPAHDRPSDQGVSRRRRQRRRDSDLPSRMSTCT
jgi:hypothetical protein